MLLSEQIVHDNHKQSGCHRVTALHRPTRAVGLSYHDSRIIHSRIANAGKRGLK